MEEIDRWVPLEEFNFEDENLVLINVDTRDFHVIGSTETETEVVEYPTRVVSIEKIKESLVRFKETSGGEKEWRHFDIVGTTYSGRWDFKYLRFRKSSEGWLFINDDRHNKHGKDSAYPADYLDKEGVDWVDWYEKNRPVEEEIVKTSFQEYEKNISDTDSYMIYQNIPNYPTDWRNYPKPSQFIRDTPKIHNNDPCSCGSNIKFKKCCKNK